MSLNLISSLSFLKSKLEKTEEVKMAEVRPKVDMFAGMTESDLDTDSDSDSDSDSSRSSSPGFRTPDTENPPGPTQDILRRCLEMLNNDLTEAERVHRENLAKEKEAQKSKKVARVEEPKKCDDVEKEDDTAKNRDAAPQGLLKIASPSPGRRSRGSMEGGGSLQIALPESRSPSPGPPLLEPQQSLPSSPSRQPVPQLSTPTKPSLPTSMATSSVVQANSLQTCTTTQSPLQKILLPPVPPGQSQQIVLQPQQAQNILQQASLQQNKAISEQPQTSLQPPMVLQNVLQQPQTIVQQPQTLIQQQPPIMQTKILQQPQTITQQPQTLLQQPQNMLPQTQTILQQPQTIIQQNQSILQQQQQPQGKPGVQVVQQAGLPLQFTSNPIPLLSHTGALLGTIGGVTNHPQLLSSLQQFTLLLQTNQSNQMNFQPNNLNNQIQIQPNMALANNQLQFQQVGCNQVQIQANPVMTNNNQVQLQATGIAQNNNNNQIQVQPSVATSTFQMQTSVGLQMSSNPSTQMQPTFANCQLQPPNLSLTGSSQVKIKQEPGCLSAVAKTTSNNTSNLLSTSQASSTPQPLVASSTNSLQLVQDPATGLYNLVPSVESSPKRCATPSSAIGSPLKLPKLLLPSLTSSKENTPSPDPNDGKFMCGVCSKYFGNQKNLRVHISEIHEGKRGEFSCDLCNKVFPRKRNMERHKNAVHLKNSPTCYMCHKSVVNLDMHIRRFHRGSAEIKIKVEETAPAT